MEKISCFEKTKTKTQFSPGSHYERIFLCVNCKERFVCFGFFSRAKGFEK